MSILKEKQIIGCVHTSDGLSPEKLIQFDNDGMDAVYLIDDAEPSNAEKLIKLIKAVNAK